MAETGISANNHWLAWPLLCLSLIMAAATLVLPQSQLAWLWPVPGGWIMPPPWLAAVICAVAALVLLLRAGMGRGRVPVSHWLPPWMWLVFAVLTGVWVIVPLPGSVIRESVFAAVLLAVLVWNLRLYWRAVPRPVSTAHCQQQFLLADLLIVLLPASVALMLVHGFAAAPAVPLPASKPLLINLLLYPLYAWLQLVLFLLLPAQGMKRGGFSQSAIVACCGLLFALLHWPNPLLMAVTGVAMLVWARQFLAGRSLLAIALIMGLAATLFKFTVPRDWSHELRIGPEYIEARAAQIEAEQSGVDL